MTYIEVPVEVEYTDLAEEAYAYLQDKVPGWLPSDGNLDAWLVQALAQLASELRVLITLVPDAIFRYYGESIINLAPHEAVAATGTTTWTMTSNAGYTIEKGTLITIAPPASTDAYAFTVDQAFTIPNGSTVQSGVTVTAVEPGAEASGITGVVESLDQLDFVQGIVLDAPTSGGADAETDDAYLARLSDLMTLLSPRPILPPDFAVMAQSVAGVARATAIDLYNPGPPVDANCPRCVTVVVVDESGNPCSPQVKSDVDTLLQSEREVNFLVFVADPTFTTIDVSFDVKAYPGWDAVDVHDRVVAALTTYLSPGNWGVPPFGDTTTRSWINDTHVRYLELAEQINRVDGVHYIIDLTSNISGQAAARVDITMPGVAPLPHAGAITGTVTVET